MKRVVVTGAAGHVGGAVARFLHGNGHSVVGIDIDPIDHQSDFGDGFKHLVCDLRCPESTTRAFESISVFEHVIHCAGGATHDEVRSEEALPSPVETAASIETNLVAAMNVVRASVPILQGADVATNRSIVLVSSINSLRDYGLPAYSAAKAALNGLMISLVGTLGRQGVRINLLTLGTIRHDAVEALHGTEHFVQLLESAPMRRFATTTDIALAADFLIECASANGSNLVIDSGQSLGRKQGGK